MIWFELQIYKVLVWKCRRLYRYMGSNAVKETGYTGKGAWAMVLGHIKPGKRGDNCLDVHNQVSVYSERSHRKPTLSLQYLSFWEVRNRASHPGSLSWCPTSDLPGSSGTAVPQTNLHNYLCAFC